MNKIEGNQRVIILSDIHIPYQNKQYLTKVLNYMIKYNPTQIVLMGDLMDCISISRFNKRLNERDLNTEIKAGIKFLSNLRKLFKSSCIYYLEGNHEARIKNYLLTHAPELSNLKELTLESLLKLDEFNIKWLGEDEILSIGSLVATHGHLIKGSSSNYPAKSAFDFSKCNVIIGHCHRESIYTCRSIKGEIFNSYSIGCLSELKPVYSIFNNFVSGFAKVDLNKNGNFQVTMINKL